MSLIGFLILLCVLIVVFGNPHLGGRVYQNYDYGYWPSGLGLVIGLILLLWLLGDIHLR